VRELVDSIFLAADSRAEKRAQDRHMVIDSGRAGAAMLVYLAPNLADDAVVGKILWDDSAQASAAATMAAFRGIAEAHHLKYFGEAKIELGGGAGVNGNCLQYRFLDVTCTVHGWQVRLPDGHS